MRSADCSPTSSKSMETALSNGASHDPAKVNGHTPITPATVAPGIYPTGDCVKVNILKGIENGVVCKGGLTQRKFFNNNVVNLLHSNLL